MNIWMIVRWIMIADTAALLFGFALDALFGDPIGKWHPVCMIGALISRLEKHLRESTDTEAAQRRKGRLAVFLVLFATGVITFTFLYGLSGLVFYTGMRTLGGPAGDLGGALITLAATAGTYVILASVITDTTIAAKDLKKESLRVYDALIRHPGSLREARFAVSRIVGRDTEMLDEGGVIRAAVETVAENTTDGVVAPLFWYMIGGPVFAMLYKAVNTMDSMTGYKNEKYLHYGRAAAKLDDAVNFLPSRLAALLWIAASALTGADAKGAWRIWRRDRFNHESPNSAQTESACAGSLGVQLAGDAVYFGKKKEKPTIGDAIREIGPEDIRQADRLMGTSAFLMLVFVLIVRGLLIAAVSALI